MPQKTVVFLLTLCFAANILADPLKGAERMRFADGLYGRQLFDLAIKEYEELLKAFPDFESKDLVLFRLGECYRRMRQVNVADRYYLRLIKEHPKSDKVFAAKFRRGELLTSIKEYDRAIEIYQALINDKSTPENLVSSSLYYKGFSLKELKKTGESEKAFQELVRRFPESQHASYGALELGNLLKGKKSGAAAEAHYRTIIQNPANPRIGAEASFQLAEMAYENKEYKTAAEAYQKLMEVYPKDRRVPEAKLQASWSFYFNRQYKLALAMTGEELARENIENREEWLYLNANCLRLLERKEEAHRAYAQLLKEFPTKKYAEAATYEKALMAFREKNYASVVQLLQGFSPMKDILKDCHWVLAEAYVAMKEPEKGIAYYDKIIQDFAQSERAPQAFYRRAEVFQAQGNWKDASASYLDLAAKYPKSELAPRALFAGASGKAQIDEFDEAVKIWGRLAKDFPNDPLNEDAMFRQGIGEVKLKRSEPALKTLDAFCKKYPDSKMIVEAQYWIAVLLEKKNDSKGAEARLRMALEKPGGVEIKNKIKFRLAGVLQRQGKDGEAADFIQQLLADKSREEMPSSLLEWLTAHRISEGKFQDALLVAEALSARAKEAVWKQIGWYLEGFCRLELKDTQKAAAAFKKAADSEGKSEEGALASLELAFILVDQKQCDQAVKYFNKAASWAADPKMAPIRARSYYGLGRCAEQKSEWELAARQYMSVAILFDDKLLTPECLYRAAEAFGKAGKRVEQRSAITELIERYPDSEWRKKLQKN